LIRDGPLLNAQADAFVLARVRAPWLARAARPFARRVLMTLAIVLAHSGVAQAQVELPPSELSERIDVAADSASHWVEGVYDVYLLRGNCQVHQGLTYARSREAVLWIERGGADGEPPHKVIAWLEGEVDISYQPGPAQAGQARPAAARLTDKTWFGRFYSGLPVDVRRMPLSPPPAIKPAVYQHAAAALGTPDGRVKPAQFAEPLPAPPAPIVGPPPGMLRIRVQGRSAVHPDADSPVVNPATGERIVIIKNGVNIVVDGLDDFGSIDVDTDNLVLWTQGPVIQESNNQSSQSKEQPLEIYMEGNVVFRQGERVIYAQRMYYDVRRQTGIVLAAEILTPVPKYEGLLKLRADVVQQLGRDSFLAQNASLTSSRFGIPGYELRSGLMTYQDIQRPRINAFTGMPEQTPDGPIIDHDKLATSRNNVLYVEQFPVFYWPFLATDLEQPNYYIDAIRVRQDRVFGTQVLTDINAYQILGMRNPPRGTKWQFSADYFSQRGFGGGTNFNYERQTLFGVPEGTSGFVDAWGVHDRGTDNLGLDRRAIPPENGELRGRVLAQHRQMLPNNFQLTGEVGYISDFNFLEQWFEREYDQLKDESTAIELKQYLDNMTWSGFAAVRLNPFFTETEWLPRGDHFWLGQPLLNDRLTWYEHTSIGYARFKSANPPTDPTQAAHTGALPWEAPDPSTRIGERLATRHEIDAPFSLGAVKFNPYAIGELARWGEALDFNDLNRAYGALGLKASIPVWSVNPVVENQLLNVHGIAHKMVFEADATYAQSTQPLSDLPLYDQIDDNDIEAYRRWFPLNDFGALPPVPPQFDERYYALRRGLGYWVASPSTEIAEDLFTTRLGLNQRWQTKRGPINNRRIVDWITLNTDLTLFPNPNRDNFGEVVGLADYNFRWHVGDRTTVVSDGYFDFFDDAPKYITLGTFLNRPPRGSLYMGIHSLQGPITSNVLATSYSYRMSPKWVSTFGTTFDLHDSRNIGQNLTVTRIGESFLFVVNVNVDASKGNVGANFAILPRFLQGRVNTGQSGPGMALPIAGAYGLE
jgi:lipopolysaccharide export system protein LptA